MRVEIGKTYEMKYPSGGDPKCFHVVSLHNPENCILHTTEGYVLVELPSGKLDVMHPEFAKEALEEISIQRFLQYRAESML